jgi:hypothetical protein
MSTFEVGDKVNYLTIQEIYTKDFGTYRKKVAVCLCDCGKETSPNLQDIKKGSTVSCGCHRNKVSAERLTTHGLSKDVIYQAWVDMVKRCTNPEYPDFHNYGGRGIGVCDEWLLTPKQFIEDMSPTYIKGYDLDREDNEGNYCKENCRWVTRKVNLRNKRKQSDTTSKYRGVSYHKTKDKWTAFILDEDGNQIWLKRHDSEKEAAIVSYKAHFEYYGFWPKYCEDHLIELGLMED